MDPTTFRDRLNERLLDFAWEEWAQMGISAIPRRESRWAQDPEALIVFTLQVARADPRLFDELLDWMLLNESLLSVRRLRAVCVDGADRALVAGSIGWLPAGVPARACTPPDSSLRAAHSSSCSPAARARSTLTRTSPRSAATSELRGVRKVPAP